MVSKTHTMDSFPPNMQVKEKKMIMVPSETNVSESFYTKLTQLLDSSGSGLSLIDAAISFKRHRRQLQLASFNVRETLLDLYLFYMEVTKRGGYHQVCQDNKWGEVVSALKLEGSNAKLSAQVEMLYAHLLYEFEQMYFFTCPAKHPSTKAFVKGPLKKKLCPAARLSQFMDMEDCQRVTICKDCSSQMTAKAGYVEQPVLLPAPSTDNERKKHRQRNAYNIFLKQECARLKACCPTLDGTSIRRMATDAWNFMSEIEKQPYVEESKKNKEKYKEEANEEMIAYNTSMEIRKEENRPSSCGDYRVPSEPEADNSVVSAELGLALKMNEEVPKESLEEWDSYLALDLPTSESK